MKQTAHGIWLPDRDKHFAEVLSHPKKKSDWGRYQTHIYRMVMEHLDEHHRRVAVDVGAHVGLLSIQMAEHFKYVIGFEAWEENAKCFRRNVEAPNVRLINRALGNKCGGATLRIIPDNSGANFIENTNATPHPVAGELWNVPMQRLDSYDLQDVDLIKLDIQGYEEQVLLGAQDTIMRNKPVILIEEVGLSGDDRAIHLLSTWDYQEAERWTKDRVMIWQG